MSKHIVSILSLVGFLIFNPSQSQAQKYGSGGSDINPSGNKTIKTSSSPENDVLETIGLMGGTSVYNTYLLIGAISDNYASESYNSSTAASLLETQIKLIDGQINQLNVVNKSFVKSSNDKQALNDINEIFAGLKKQAEFGLEYVNGGDADAADNFEAQRQANWEAISELLGLNED